MKGGRCALKGMHSERVTLSDFHRLQQSLLETKQELYGRTEELRRVRQRAEDAESALAAANAAAAASSAASAAASYPDMLNPFSGGSSSSSVPPSNLNVVSQTGASDARAAIRAARVRERCEAAQRLAAVQRRWLVRLMFHAWRSSHNQTEILRNMSNMVQAQAARHTGTAELPVSVKPALHRLVVERSESDCVDGNGHGRRASCASQDSTTIESLRAQIMRLEGELARTRTAHLALRERCRIGTQALRELCVTAAAMHGRALCGLEDAALDDDAPTD